MYIFQFHPKEFWKPFQANTHQFLIILDLKCPKKLAHVVRNRRNYMKD